MGHLFDVLTRKEQRTFFDDAEFLAGPPTGGRARQWLLGVAVAIVPIVHGIRGLWTGSLWWPQKGTGEYIITGAGESWMSAACIAMGVFLHFQFFWGLRERLWNYSETGKLIAASVLVVSLFRGLWLQFTFGM